MCGVFAYSGTEPDAAVTVMGGLRTLEYRGYDSWGIAVVGEFGLCVEKRVGRIGVAQRTSLGPSRTGIGHTRWATHGKVTESNAHPHTGCTNRIAIVHNGVVENHRSLRLELERRGHRFASETDTEVISHLVEDQLSAGATLLTAASLAGARLEGSSAFVALDAADGHIVAVRRGSPLVLGVGPTSTWIASDVAALVAHTRDVVYLNDGESAAIFGPEVHVIDSDSGAPVGVASERLEAGFHSCGLEQYPHFMLKEIAEQPAIWRAWARSPASRLQPLLASVRSAERVVIVGCGTAYHAALSARSMLAAHPGIAVTAAVASEPEVLLPELRPGTLCIALSQSGETADVLRMVRIARERGVTVVAVVNAPGSSLDRLANATISLGAGSESCVLATKSYTAKLAVLLLLATTLSGSLDRAAADLEEAASKAEEMLEVGYRQTVRDRAQQLRARSSMFVVGRGSSFPLALEAALKIKEGTYIHAEGFAGGELKHGAIALIEPGTPCLALTPGDQTLDLMLASASEVAARGGFVVGLGPEQHDSFADWLPVDGAGMATPLVQAIAVQLLAYELALLRGIDPDRPRNLAKSVTVV